MLPFSLDRGLLLEDRQVFLPWGLAWQDVTNFDPDTNESGLVSWQSVSCLGGMLVSVLGRPIPARMVRDLEIAASQAGETPSETFARVGAHLRASFGEPSASASDPLPHEEWKMPPITIHHGIFDRFGEYHVMRIRHRGPIENIA